MNAPKRVLIAEDEALIRLDLAEMLTEEGFEPVWSHDVRDGFIARVSFSEVRGII